MAVMTHLLLLLCAAVTVSTAVDLSKRVIHGKDCAPDERLYHVRLIGSNPGKPGSFLCGGSLISKRWILTAAHCEKGITDAEVGVHPLGGTPKQVVKNKSYKKWNIFPLKKKTHDIMLMELPDDVVGITPVELPDDTECKARRKIKTFQVAGHAATTLFPNGTKGNDFPATLKCGNMNQVSCKDELKRLKKDQPDFYKDVSSDHLLCATCPDVDTAPGDSGGGLVYNGKIYGVVSFGPETNPCAPPAAFMDVCKYKEWIKKTAGIK